MLWFLFPGMAEQVSAEDDWAFFRRWAWDGVRLGQDPPTWTGQVADLSGRVRS